MDRSHLNGTGLTAARSTVNGTATCAAGEPSPRDRPKRADKAPAAAPIPRLRKLSTAKIRPVEWLWRDRIPLGAITLIAGEGGLGKSMITASLAACVTNDQPYPCGAHGPQGSALIISCEDDEETTLAPRLLAAGADLDKVITFSESDLPDGARVLFDLDSGMEAFTAAIDQIADLRLVVIDPATAFCGRRDSHTAADVRAMLRPLADLAAQRGIAVVLVTHFNKSAAQSAAARVMGSGAWVHAARVAYAVVSDEGDEDRRLMLIIKNNLGPDRSGFAYRIDTRPIEGAGDTAFVAWESEPVRMTAQDALAQGDGEVLSDAKAFMQRLLADGKVMASAEFEQACRAAGYAGSTIKRARKAAGVRSKRSSTAWSVSLRAEGG